MASVLLWIGRRRFIVYHATGHPSGLTASQLHLRLEFRLIGGIIMKVIPAIVIVVLCATTSANLGNVQTQLDMNQAAFRELEAAEAEMNTELEHLFKLAHAAGELGSAAKLEQAQAAWLAYREAHVRALWPSEEPGAYGSVHSMCVAHELTRLTLARLAELRSMTDWVEGDVGACRWPY